MVLLCTIRIVVVTTSRHVYDGLPAYNLPRFYNHVYVHNEYV